jgi:hypothetical protein|tara:strand:- start:254 stop:565 length:312 start_codon:yes stop_codon:yes gene_type:complete
MSDKINENDVLSRLLTLAGIQPTVLVVQNQADEEVAQEEVEVAGTNEPDEQEIDIDALTPSKKAQRKLRFVPARQGDNPIEETLEDKESRLAEEYESFKNEQQ